MLSRVSKERVEDPKRIEAFMHAFQELDWSEEYSQSSIKKLYAEISKLVLCEIQYYYQRKVKSRRLSRVFRLVMLAGSAVGVLSPICAPFVGSESAGNFLSIGYIGFTVTGIAYVADSLFGGSKAFQRRAATQLKLEQLYVEFSTEWQNIIAKNINVIESNPTNLPNNEASSGAALKTNVDNNKNEQCSLYFVFIQELFLCVRSFLKYFYECMGNETAQWSESLSKSIDDINKQSSKSGK